jgi:hypothetical protein
VKSSRQKILPSLHPGYVIAAEMHTHDETN